MNKLQFLSFAVVVALSCACSDAAKPQSADTNIYQPKEALSRLISKDEAVEIAKRAVSEKGWQKAELQSASFEMETWEISLMRVPSSPGGHAVIKISATGEILQYIPGA